MEKVANVDFSKEKPEGTASSQLTNSVQFMSSSITSHSSSVTLPTRPDSSLSNPPESNFLHSQVFEMDENNNRIPTPTTDMQALNKAQNYLNAPPLPPLPANLQQKAQEQQEKLMRAKSPTLATVPLNSSSQHNPSAQTAVDKKPSKQETAELNNSEQKKAPNEPIVINAQVELNSNNSNEKKKYHSDIVTITASTKGYKNLRLNLTLPGEDRTQF
jgi:hypothetical protein